MRPAVFLISLMLLLSMVSIKSHASLAAKEKLSPMLQKQLNFNQSDALSVLVYLRGKADLSRSAQLKSKQEKGAFVYKTLKSVALRAQAPFLKWLSGQKITYQRFYIVNMIALFDVNAEAILQISKRSDVEKIVLNPSFKALPETSFAEVVMSEMDDAMKADGGESKGPGANIVNTGADQVWTKLNVRGEGIVVAGQDTGVEWRHPALVRQYRGASGDHAYSWHDSIKSTIGGDSNSCGYNLSEPCDDNGHGTHTIGTVVGDDGNGNQVGMAPQAKWIACRNMDAGFGRPSTYIECFEWFLAPYPQGQDPLTAGRSDKAPHVINNSWGCPAEEGCHEAEILPILRALKAAGVMVVASAGNEGSACSTIQDAPAMHSEETLSVGAHSHSTGAIANFSSRGPSTYDGQIGPDVTAPGVNIRSSTVGGGYSGFMWSGTSMAGPHVVGEVALLWSAKKNLIGKIEETVAIIRNSATAKITSESCGGVSGSKVPNNTFGYGAINAYKALTL
ncbi:MAG: S8 family serine peptidase [Oligoflexia bacterium]|nr:S8 family serine peptidase [Oligoflexia bacterium]